MFDLVRYSWLNFDVSKEKTENLLTQVLLPTFSEYPIKNLQARIGAYLLEHIVFTEEPGTEEFASHLKESVEPVTELINTGDLDNADLGLRTIRFFLSNIDERETSQRH